MSRYSPVRIPVPEDQSTQALCVCCRYPGRGQTISRDGLWATCKRCDEGCTNVGCRTLRPRREGIYGRLVRYARSPFAR